MIYHVKHRTSRKYKQKGKGKISKEERKEEIKTTQKARTRNLRESMKVESLGGFWWLKGFEAKAFQRKCFF